MAPSVNDDCVAGSVGSAESIVRQIDPGSILLFTGGASYRASGAAAAIDAAIEGTPVEVIADVAPNPELDDVDAAIDTYRRMSPDLIIAVGGGSVIDLAKTVRLIAPHSPTALPYALGERMPGPTKTPLLAIPTTAGTGSEATHFAVVYVDGRKYSIADPAMRPDHVILDPELTYSAPPSVTAASGLDALCQAIESYWSVRSTAASRDLARRAIELAFTHLDAVVNRPDADSRAAMCRAAHLAGRAIDVSFTTAPHAFSYTITSRFGLPHGHAVAMTLGAVLEYNANTTEDDCADPRGVDHVQRVMNDVVSILGAPDAAGARRVFDDLVRRVGLDPTLDSIDVAPAETRALIADGVNEQRLRNNPRRMTPESVVALLATVD